MQRGLESAAKHASEVTQAFTPEGSGDPTEALVGMKLDEFQVAASAKVIKTGDELQKAILDIVA